MTDDELASALNLSPTEAAIVISKLTPERRAAYEKLSTLADELVLWQEGVAPFPDGILSVSMPHKKRGGRHDR